MRTTKVNQMSRTFNLPRRYRPQSLGDLRGQRQAREMLQQLAGYLLAGEVPATKAVCCEVKEGTSNVGSLAAKKAWQTRRNKER